MGSIALNKPSGGQLILSPEDGTSNETVEIPASGVGKIVQVQSFTTNTYTTTSSTSMVNTPISVTLNNVLPTSRIIIEIHLNGCNTNGGTTYTQVTDNGNLIAYLGSSAQLYASTNETSSNSYSIDVDTLSAGTHVFTVQFLNTVGSVSRINDYTNLTYRERSSITVWEVAQ